MTSSTATTAALGGWESMIERYLADLAAFGRCSRNTRLSYRRCLELHGEDAEVGPLQTTREHVKLTLRRWRGNTQYQRHTALTSFYDWVMEEGLRPDNPARQVRRTKKRATSVYRLTAAEAIGMMGAAQTPSERRVTYLGLLTGARVAEMGSMQVRHLERPGWVWFSEDITKGGKERWVPVLPELEPVVEEILRSSDPMAFVIPTRNQVHARLKGQRPQPASREIIKRMVTRVAERAGIVATIHPHLLRHAFGDHVARHAGLRTAQALMGHTSVSTTASIYVGRPSLDEIAANVRGFAGYGAQNGAETPETDSLIAEFAQFADRARAAGLDLATLTSTGGN